MIVIDMMLVWLIFTYLLWLIVYWYEDYWAGFIVGVMFVVMAIFIITYGIDDTNNWLTRSLGFVQLGIGLIIFLISSYHVVENPGAEPPYEEEF